MDVMGLLILLLPALSTPSLAASREYHLVIEQKSWSEAQSYCREHFHDLATVESEDDWNTVRDILINQDVNYVWIGLYEDVNTWRWSLDNTSIDNLGSWFDFSANNYGENSYCAYGYNGKLHDTNCETAHNSICYDEQLHDGNCENSLPALCYDEPSDTFIEVTTAMSWHSAQSYCRQTHTELAGLRTQEEWDAVLSLAGSSKHWVGLTRDTWRWSDQSESQYRIWKSGEPDDEGNHCGTARTSGMGDTWCPSTEEFICSVPIKKVSKVVLKTDGSDDPNDAQIRESALKQIEQQLREHGVRPEFSLSWRKQLHGKAFKKTELSTESTHGHAPNLTCGWMRFTTPPV